jgi:glycerate dehydrogenase
VLNKIKLTEAVLKNAPNLKLICVAATGFDNIDTKYCRENGIAVANVPGYSTHSVAAVTVATVLNLLTHLKEYSAFVEDGSYTASGAPNRLSPVFHDLYGKTWGIVGLGNIGSKTAEIASAFGCRVIGTRSSGKPHPIAEVVDIDRLCRESDIITLHLPLNDASRHLISRDRLSMMKSNVILVNAARGAVVDEAAVADAVLDGKIAGFGCDVFSREPMAADHPYARLLDRDNVLLTPHMAWGAYEARVRCLEEVKLNIESYLRGERRSRVES